MTTMTTMTHELDAAEEAAARQLHKTGGGMLATWRRALALRAMLGSSWVPMRYRNGGEVSVGCLAPVEAYSIEAGTALRIPVLTDQLIPIPMSYVPHEEPNTGGTFTALGWATHAELTDRVRRKGGAGARFLRAELLPLEHLAKLAEVRPFSADPAPRTIALAEATVAAMTAKASQAPQEAASAAGRAS